MQIISRSRFRRAHRLGNGHRDTYVRRMLGGRQQEMYEQLIDLMTKTASNADFFNKLKGWLAVYEKEGYSLGK